MAIALTAPASRPSTALSIDEHDYHPGTCNIGPAEIERRRRAGHFGLVVTLATLAVLIIFHAPPLARLVVALPAAATAVCYLEAMLKFCVAFGSRGIFNFGALGSFATVADPRARGKDRVRALQIALGGVVLGVLVGVVAVALPA